MEENKEWFKDWFSSPYYDILYQKRDKNEAAVFVANLVKVLHPAPHARVLDIGCGEGRYAYYLANTGLNVTGIDLSARRIQIAQKLEQPNLHFYVHDMRIPFKTDYFDFCFNFFTSFGYFDSPEENKATAKAFSDQLKNNGFLVLDYMNVALARKNLVAHEEKTLKGIPFTLDRKEAGGKIIKDIRFTTENKTEYHFQERVSAFELEDFRALFEPRHLYIQKIYGDYELNDFDIEKSPRLIMLFQKKEQE